MAQCDHIAAELRRDVINGSAPEAAASVAAVGGLLFKQFE